MCKLISVLKHVDTNVNGHEVVLSFCKTCKITRPPRTFHCSRCDACIEVHDHHCPWVGTCVGKRNHKYFTSFITYVSIHAAFTFATGLVSLINQYEYKYSDGKIMMINFPLWIITIYGGMMIFAMFPFSSYHACLLAMGRTTNEEVRGRYDKWRGNPFDRGSCIGNCRDAIKYYPSLVFTEREGSPKLTDENATI